MSPDPRTVSDLGEDRLIEAIRDWISAAPVADLAPGDDSAVVVSPGERLLHSTDMLVEGVDFDFSYCSGADVGWKSIAANVSDIAAMGGRPEHLVTALGLSPATEVSLVRSLAEGLAAAAEHLGVGLAGGDISRARDMTISVSIVGVAESEPVLRSGARPGDAICVTGSLGGAAGGLALLRAGHTEQAEPERRLQTRQLRPCPRVLEGRVIARYGATAMIDVSDGLVVDLTRIMTASGTGCSVDPAAVPVDPELRAAALPEGFDPVAAALGGGEDFELLFTIDSEVVGRLAAELRGMGTPLAVIGRVTTGEARFGDVPLSELERTGWDHLRA